MSSKDYHDYMIKDGKFIGKFEERYQNCEDPWNQDTVQPFSDDIALLNE